MKRILLFLLVACLLLFPSCTGRVKKEKTTPSRPSSEVTVKYNGTEYTADVVYSDIGTMTVKTVSPFRGLTVTVSDSRCELENNGMKLNYTTEQMKSFCPFLELYGLLKTVCYTVPESLTESSDKLILNYKSSELSCKAITKKSDGTIISIETNNLKFIFNNN